ncbi:MAG: recombinase family protein [Burkholderiales bacterium]
MSKITTAHLERAACVYVRQSSIGQLQNNHESRKRQYALAERAKEFGFCNVVVIDEDLGLSGAGTPRPGFERLLALMCEGQVGAVFAFEASRLARNGRDWHTLLEICALVDSVLVDEEAVYDPRQPNDRLLLGMKGTFSEMELSLLRQRAIEAIRLKAARGEHYSQIVAGFVRGVNGLQLDPDTRVRQAVAMVFRKFDELQSARQVLYWVRQEKLLLPVVQYASEGRRISWKAPTYPTVHHMLTNPVYSGAYVFGRTATEVRLEGGRKRTRKVFLRNPEQWRVCIPKHHDGYITWEDYQRNQHRLAENASMRGEAVRGPVRRGEALLGGLLRCGHCGRRLYVAYTIQGTTKGARYICRGDSDADVGNRCISFAAWRVDQAVVAQLLKVISPLGVQAALQAIQARDSQGDEKQRHAELALEHARYEARHAQRQYEAVDPENRLVAAELERRWNVHLETVCRLDAELANARSCARAPMSEQERKQLLALGSDLQTAWSHPKANAETRKRILRVALNEIVVCVQNAEVQLVLHWQGGDHTALSVRKNRTGEHRWTTEADIEDLIAALARLMPDFSIAALLNRLGLRSAKGHTWTESRVRSFRGTRHIAVHRAGERAERGEVNLDEAAGELGVGKMMLLRMIARGILPAQQACKGAPWVIRLVDLNTDQVKQAAAGLGGPLTADPRQDSLEFQ